MEMISPYILEKQLDPQDEWEAIEKIEEKTFKWL